MNIWTPNSGIDVVDAGILHDNGAGIAKLKEMDLWDKCVRYYPMNDAANPYKELKFGADLVRFNRATEGSIISEPNVILGQTQNVLNNEFGESLFGGDNWYPEQIYTSVIACNVYYEATASQYMLQFNDSKGFGHYMQFSTTRLVNGFFYNNNSNYYSFYILPKTGWQHLIFILTWEPDGNGTYDVRHKIFRDGLLQYSYLLQSGFTPYAYNSVKGATIFDSSGFAAPDFTHKMNHLYHTTTNISDEQAMELYQSFGVVHKYPIIGQSIVSGLDLVDNNQTETLTSMTPTVTGIGTVGYQLSNDSGVSFLYFDGSDWVPPTADNHYNSLTVLNNNISTLPTGDKKFRVKALLTSLDGYETPILGATTMSANNNQAPSVTTGIGPSGILQVGDSLTLFENGTLSTDAVKVEYQIDAGLKKEIKQGNFASLQEAYTSMPIETAYLSAGSHVITVIATDGFEVPVSNSDTMVIFLESSEHSDIEDKLDTLIADVNDLHTKEFGNVGAVTPTILTGIKDFTSENPANYDLSDGTEWTYGAKPKLALTDLAKKAVVNFKLDDLTLTDSLGGESASFIGTPLPTIVIEETVNGISQKVMKATNTGGILLPNPLFEVQQYEASITFNADITPSGLRDLVSINGYNGLAILIFISGANLSTYTYSDSSTARQMNTGFTAGYKTIGVVVKYTPNESVYDLLIELYFDGILENSFAYNGIGAPSFALGSLSRTNELMHLSGLTVNGFHEGINNFTLYKEALTALEMLEIHNKHGVLHKYSKIEYTALYKSLGLYLPFGGNTLDASATNKTVVPTAITYKDGKFGTNSVAIFDGLTSNLIINTPIFTGTASAFKMGMSFWFKRLGGTYARIISHDIVDYFRLEMFTATELRLITDTNNVHKTGIDISTEAILITLNIVENGTSELFINGVSVGTASTGTLGYNSASQLAIGANRYGTGNNTNFECEQFLVKDNAIFTAQEALELFNDGQGLDIVKVLSAGPSLTHNISHTNSNLKAFDTYALTKTGLGDIGIQLSDDDGVTWKFFDGADWVNTLSQVNSPTMIATNIATFPVANKSIRFKYFLLSDGDTQVELVSETLTEIENIAPVVSAGDPKPLTGVLYDDTLVYPYDDATLTDDSVIAGVRTKYNSTDYTIIPQGEYSSFLEAIQAKNFSTAVLGNGIHVFTLEVTDDFNAKSYSTVTVTIASSHIVLLASIDTKSDSILADIGTLDTKTVTNTGKIDAVDAKIDVIDTIIDATVLSISTLDTKIDDVKTVVDSTLVLSNTLDGKLDASIIDIATIANSSDALTLKVEDIHDVHLGAGQSLNGVGIITLLRKDGSTLATFQGTNITDENTAISITTRVKL